MIWIYEGELALNINRRSWRGIAVSMIPSTKRSKAMSDPTLYHTRFTPPQLELIELDDEQWRSFSSVLPEPTASV